MYILKCIEESSINRYDVSSFIIVLNVTIYYLLKKKKLIKTKRICIQYAVLYNIS